MKKYLIALLTGLVTAATGQAALVLNEPFTYADGSLIVNSGYIWTNHSGTVGQLQVTSGKAVLVGTQTEDVNARISGAPIATGSLYASFTLNFSTLPGTSPAYFAHFKDDATGPSSFFRGRLFSTVTGAAAGSFRLGVASAGTTPVVIPKDLALAADHVVVLRYNIATGGTTAWIAPNSEDALSDRADSTDTGTVGPLTAFALRQASGIGTFTLDDLKVGTTFADVVSGSNPALNPPVISAIPDQSIPRNGTTPPVTFVVRDGETAPGLLTVAATASSNPTLLPTANINITSDGTTNRTLTATPVAGQQGFSQVTVTVTDGDANTATRTFLVIVGAPTLAPIANADTVTNTPTSVSLRVGDAESDALTLDAISTNSVLIPEEALLFSGSGSNRTLSITPAPDVAGVSRITVLVSDGHNTVSNSFLVTVAPKIGLVFSDEFNYPDGPLVSGSSFVWNTHSGSNDQMRVSNGRILVTSTNSEDVSAFLGVTSFPPGGGWVLYSSFTADFQRLPGGTDYFAHFKNASISFGARIYVTTNGAAPGKLRLGIANAGGTPSVIFPVDLATNVTHTVVCRYNVGTGQSRLWVNPTSEGSQSVTATDTAFPFEVFTYSFRESSGIGDIYVDSLKVGTSFADVLVVRPSLAITRTGSSMTLTWPASASGYVLRFTEAFPALWADYADQGTVVGDNKVVTIPNPTGSRFFQLRQP